jgi:hypothetical protein
MIEQLFANSATTTIAVGKSAADATNLIAAASVSATATIS